MIQIRNVPDEVHSEIRRRALKSGLSMSDYILREIMKVVRRPTLEEVLERAANRPGGGSLTFEQAVRAVHEGREER
jgi:plasmid stability protein